jgi:subtilisin family serine protease
VSSTLYTERADHVVDTGYMELSGTSFAAPVASGVAALVLGQHPEFTPDQVKGALMLGAKPMPRAANLSVGVGEVSAARSLQYLNPPKANKALNAFVVSASGASGRVFDSASWADKAKNDASWAEASWADASWADASWATASWADASWADASWSDLSFASASWADTATAAASWADLSLASASWADNAGDETAQPDAGAIDPAELSAILAGTLDP